MTKKEQISATLKATREKRKGQICRVFEVKLDSSHFNKDTEKDIGRLFLEAKWYRNHAIAQKDIKTVSDKLDKVQIKVKDKFEEREIKILSSQMKQSVLSQIKDDIIGLSKKKKKGKKIGKLKFKSRCNSINLKQFGNTYRIQNKRIKIQNINQWIPVNGLNQIAGYEIANAKLLQKPSGYYLHITCYLEKEIVLRQQHEKELKLGIIRKQQCGGDLGILNQMTLSNGVEIKYGVEVATKKLRKLHKRASRKIKNSKNRENANRKLAKEYEITNNRKHDISNKIINIIKTEFCLFGYQDDNLSGWQRIWGRRMLNTAIGGITSGLKQIPTSVEIDRFAPTTKECPICTHKQDISLAERIFKCDNCGYRKPRDWKSAENILDRAIKKIGAERIQLTPVEIDTSTRRIMGRLNAIPRVRASSVVETGSPAYL